MILPILLSLFATFGRIRAPHAMRTALTPAVVLVALSIAGPVGAQVIEQRSVTRDGDRITATVRVVTTDGIAVSKQPISWSIENPRDGDRVVSTSGPTNGAGEASAVVVLGPTPGTRNLVASISSGLQLSAFFVAPNLIRIPISNDEILASEGLKTFVLLPQIGLDTTFVQMRNVTRRIREIRSGGPAVSVFGTALAPAPAPGDIRIMSLSEAGRVAAANTANEALGGRFGAFLNGQGSIGTRDGTAYTRGYDTRTTGVTGGVDYRFTENLVLGAALGAVRAKSSFDADYGDASATGVAGSLYGSWYHGNFYVDAIGTFGFNRYDTRRAIGIGDVLGATNGRQLGGSVSVGWNTSKGALSFGPYVRAGYIRVDVDSFTETGSTGSEMDVSSQAATSFTTALGGQVSYAISHSWGILSPSLRVEYEREQRNTVQPLTGSLLADPVRTLFAIPTDNPDKTYFNVGAGVAAQFANGRAAFINYEGMFGRSQMTNHAVVVGGRLEF
ncbi:MAG: autotransporter outer membrane beta-barrel domain-containing protein [Burkholderiales bacterium]|nr:autotransporter outer membrane beta-barrel domain-containing protein [Burkholderiales bacterium]